MSKVDFFIVGAPKCGTTSLHYYLKEHPEIFMPHIKDRPYFGDDIYSDMDDKEHKNVYKRPVNKKITGESCVWYLYSKTAARQIKKYNPKAKIIMILRNPADMLYSLHSELLYAKVESEKDFKKALDLEDTRKKIDKQYKYNPWGRKFLYYSEVASYSKHIKKFFRLFGRKNVHIIIFDDFIDSPESTYKSVLKYLGVHDLKFSPEFKKYNPNKLARSQVFQKFVVAPPDNLRRVVQKVLPYKMRYQLVKTITKLNTYHKVRAKMSRALRMSINSDYEKEIKRLENLLNISLSRWYLVS